MSKRSKSKCPNRISYKTVVLAAGLPIRILEANRGRTRAVLQNGTGTNGFNIGPDKTVAAGFLSGGFPIGTAPGGDPVIANRIELYTTGEVWGISSSGVNVQVLEEIAD